MNKTEIKDKISHLKSEKKKLQKNPTALNVKRLERIDSVIAGLIARLNNPDASIPLTKAQIDERNKEQQAKIDKVKAKIEERKKEEREKNVND